MKVGVMVWHMGFHATFNNIPVISWRSVLLVEETGVPGETTDLSSNLWMYIILLPISLTNWLPLWYLQTLIKIGHYRNTLAKNANQSSIWFQGWRELLHEFVVFLSKPTSYKKAQNYKYCQYLNICQHNQTP